MEFRLKAMDMWYRALPGSMLLDMEIDQLRPLVQQAQGEFAVQIGGPADFSILHKCPIAHKVYLSPQVGSVALRSHLQAELDALPLQPDSIDLILLVHMLEFATDPKAVLEQMVISLKPQGQLMILGFNPYSWWGIARYLRGRKGFPWQGHFWSMGHVIHWLRALNMQVVVTKTFFFRPPSDNYRHLKKWLYWEPAGQLCMPGAGAVFLVTAQKRVVGMTPEVEKWWVKKLFVSNQYVKPTTRSGINNG